VSIANMFGHCQSRIDGFILKLTVCIRDPRRKSVEGDRTSIGKLGNGQ
jgi:hypothetical protein